MDEVQRLLPLPAIGRTDACAIREIFPQEARRHPGRMRVALARELIRIYGGKHLPDTVVGDPMTGTGVTAVASLLEGTKGFIGCEFVDAWCKTARTAIETIAARESTPFTWEVLCQDGADTHLSNGAIQLLLTSPPFPNAHSQGRSEMQDGLRDTKSTHAGNDFNHSVDWGLGSNPKEELWTQQLARVLYPWMMACEIGAYILVHVKNFVRGGEEVRVDLWAASALEQSGIAELVGYHPVPLNYRSAFQEWRRFPRVKVVERWKDDALGKWVERLACNHQKVRAVHEARQLPKSAICIECGQIEGLFEVREERIVVARKRRMLRKQDAGVRGDRGNLTEKLKEAPDEVFWKVESSSRRVPNYNALLGWLLRSWIGNDAVDATVSIRVLEEGGLVNLSSFQRSVAKEGRRRAGR